MADTAVLLEIITYIFQRTPPTADCDEPLNMSATTILISSEDLRKKITSNCKCFYLRLRRLLHEPKRSKRIEGTVPG